MILKLTKKGENVTDAYVLDRSVIDEEEKYDGFYVVATNLEDSAKDILNVANPEDMCYMSTYTSLHLCAALNAITGLGLDENYYEPKDLK